MPKNKKCDETLINLYNSFNNDFGRNVPVTSYNELKKEICAIMWKKQNQNTLEDKKLRTEAKLSETKNREYLSDFALAISIMSIAVSFFFDSALLLFTGIGLALGIIAVIAGLAAYRHHKKLRCLIVYSEFKLKCIEEVEKKKIKHVSVVKVCKR